jgi:flagellar protein FliO/FliZ
LSFLNDLVLRPRDNYKLPAFLASLLIRSSDRTRIMLSTGMQWLRRVVLCALCGPLAAPLLAQSIAPTSIKFATGEPTNTTGEPTLLAPPALPDWPDQHATAQPARAEAKPQAIGPTSNQMSAAPRSFVPPMDAQPVGRAMENSSSFAMPVSAELPSVPSDADSIQASTPSPSAMPSTAPALDGLSPARDPRKLSPPKTNTSSADVALTRPAASHSFLPDFGLPFEAMYTTGTALAIVVGLFLLCAWALRRGAKRSSNLLSNDVAQVLGRVPLAARQFAELVHVGNKLVLLSVTAAGAEPLTEITDPIEVNRLLGICKQKDGRSSTAEFDEMFRQLSEEAAPDGFLGEEVIRLDARSAAGAYAAQRGGRRSA